MSRRKNKKEPVKQNLKVISEVNIVSDGVFTICKTTMINGSVGYYNWLNKSDRQFIRESVTDDVIIIVDDNVEKGWDYD